VESVAVIGYGWSSVEPKDAHLGPYKILKKPRGKHCQMPPTLIHYLPVFSSVQIDMIPMLIVYCNQTEDQTKVKNVHETCLRKSSANNRQVLRSRKVRNRTNLFHSESESMQVRIRDSLLRNSLDCLVSENVGDIEIGAIPFKSCRVDLKQASNRMHSEARMEIKYELSNAKWCTMS